ncbi:hypothetical protein FOMG_17235 [Fusarium oxysporum f. sp. melonis 26406]|uniref:Uncharacterized protein n=1 Tax=Fusarium oxysporum f. sp. melonis 26406 TaxID=1089452 RepID=W9ZD53_FUSOX|nr:hypothetical protein FOMG_17235 [Fusarium oxysporum f. sp. melonis 26406]
MKLSIVAFLAAVPATIAAPAAARVATPIAYPYPATADPAAVPDSGWSKDHKYYPAPKGGYKYPEYTPPKKDYGGHGGHHDEGKKGNKVHKGNKGDEHGHGQKGNKGSKYGHNNGH